MREPRDKRQRLRPKPTRSEPTKMGWQLVVPTLGLVALFLAMAAGMLELAIRPIGWYASISSMLMTLLWIAAALVLAALLLPARLDSALKLRGIVERFRGMPYWVRVVLIGGSLVIPLPGLVLAARQILDGRGPADLAGLALVASTATLGGAVLVLGTSLITSASRTSSDILEYVILGIILLIMVAGLAGISWIFLARGFDLTGMLVVVVLYAGIGFATPEYWNVFGRFWRGHVAFAVGIAGPCILAEAGKGWLKHGWQFYGGVGVLSFGFGACCRALYEKIAHGRSLN